MRQYEPIWIRIKTKNIASIVAPLESHKRIIKAIIKEKYKDIEYKNQLIKKCLKAELVVTKDSTNLSLLTFSLKLTILTKCIGIKDL